jgi:glutathione S-transferase
MEEMGIEYELKTLPFPPRILQKGYLEINPLGTVPYLIDGDTRMTESSAMCHYFVERYGPTPLAVPVSDPFGGNAKRYWEGLQAVPSYRRIAVL